ncbi:S-layer homology domain-containing protein [Paenibacillus turicensis]|uniref:S-layer homology domain-containing protein n=1 Tax=Paenibacillus turicensis TaxID=160487 RepID=UPI003D2CE353
MKKRSLPAIMVASLLLSSTGIPMALAESGTDQQVATEASESVKQEPKMQESPFTDIQGHWAEANIKQAFTQGYISASANGKFNPNQFVTRAEFLKMLIVAQNITVESTNQGEAWYIPYVTAGENKGIYKSGEFKAMQWTSSITRQEMARMAVRAIGSEDKDNDEMYVAVQKGLISGTGNGKLSPEGKTTRAQAITIIERVLKISEGEKLPVDDKALSTAEQVKNAPKDPWGRAIRTTNLPKNYKDFPYILADAPNELYDLNHESPFPENLRTPNQFFQSDSYNKDGIDKLAEYVEQFVNQIVNVDYTTLNQNWADKLIAVMNPTDDLKEDVAEYIKDVKANKVKIQGTVKAEPSIIFIDGSTYMRIYFSFKVTSFKDQKKPIFYDFWKSKINIKKNIEYIGYSNIPLSTIAFGVAADDYSYTSVSNLASLFKEATYRPK